MVTKYQRFSVLTKLKEKITNDSKDTNDRELNSWNWWS